MTTLQGMVLVSHIAPMIDAIFHYYDNVFSGYMKTGYLIGVLR